MTGRRVLVLTVVHHPEDARIRQRQIPALLEAGWQVTYAAPWSGHGLPVPHDEDLPRGLTVVDVRRAQGRRRLAAHGAARRVLRTLGRAHDLVLLHDPELVPLTVGLRLPPVVWDVHEDTAAAVAVRPWVPGALRRPLAGLVAAAERWAEGRVHLLLADRHYARRFRRPHPVVPNSTPVPTRPSPAGRPDASGRQRVVYLGSLTRERGADQLAELGRRLRATTGDRVRLEVIGPAHGDAAATMTEARRRGDLDWAGFVPGPEALRRLDGALAGLSPLHDTANFRPSMPTKVVEYLAHGVPVISTPLPLAVDLVRRSGAGTVVPFGDVDRTLEQVLAWADHPDLAADLGRRGHDLVRAELDWGQHAAAFVAQLERVAAGRTA